MDRCGWYVRPAALVEADHEREGVEVVLVGSFLIERLAERVEIAVA